MTVSDVMTTTVVTVEMDDSLETIQAIFERVRFHHLLVIENDKLFGVISDRDLLKAISPFTGTPSEREKDIHTLNKRAHQIMSRRPVTILPGDTIENAIDTILTQNVSCLPVVNEERQIVGILTWRDLLKHLQCQQTT